MPTYEYKCLDCQETFEFFQSMTDEPFKECPQCGGELKRLIGAGVGPIFKGTGFYQTDYKAPAKKDNSIPESSTKKETKEKKETKSK